MKRETKNGIGNSERTRRPKYTYCPFHFMPCNVKLNGERNVQTTISTAIHSSLSLPFAVVVIVALLPSHFADEWRCATAWILNRNEAVAREVMKWQHSSFFAQYILLDDRRKDMNENAEIKSLARLLPQLHMGGEQARSAHERRCGVCVCRGLDWEKSTESE